MNNIVVKGLNWIGDAVISSPFFESLKLGRPDIRITVICRKWVAEVYKNNKFIDEIIELNDKTEKLQLMKLLRSRKFEEGILLPKSLSSALLFKLGGVNKLYGYSAQFRRPLLFKYLNITDEILNKHQVFLYLELAYLCGGQKLANPRIFLDTHSEYDNAVSSKWLTADKKYFGINSGAAFGPAKRWLPEYFAETITAIYSEYGYIPVLFGASNEKQIGELILNNLNPEIPTLNLIGKTNLQELFSCIKHCSVFLTNDSGPMHIAAALGVPTVAIFGSTNDITTGPFSNNAIVLKSSEPCAPCIKRHCAYNTYACMKNIKPSDAVDKLKHIINISIIDKK